MTGNHQQQQQTRGGTPGPVTEGSNEVAPAVEGTKVTGWENIVKNFAETLGDARPSPMTMKQQQQQQQQQQSTKKQQQHQQAHQQQSANAFPSEPSSSNATQQQQLAAQKAAAAALLLGIRTATPSEVEAVRTANDYLSRVFAEDLHPTSSSRGAASPIDNMTAEVPILRTLPPLPSQASSATELNPPRVIIVGDVHGCAAQLEALLAKVHFRLNVDQLVMVGDLVNKGPDSIAVIRLCQRYQAVAVLGNHDFTLLELCAQHRRTPFQQADLKDPVKRLAITFPPDCEQYLRRLPHIIAIPQYRLVVVHAGIDPRVPHLSSQSIYNLMHMRRVDVSREGNDGVVVRGDAGELWGSLYEGPETIIFGHAAKTAYQQHRFAIGIDTGCVYGDSLTAMMYSKDEPTGAFVAVKGLPRKTNESKGLPPPESDLYERHLLLPAQAVERSIVRPHSTPASLLPSPAEIGYMGGAGSSRPSPVTSSTNHLCQPGWQAAAVASSGGATGERGTTPQDMNPASIAATLRQHLDSVSKTTTPAPSPAIIHPVAAATTSSSGSNAVRSSAAAATATPQPVEAAPAAPTAASKQANNNTSTVDSSSLTVVQQTLLRLCANREFTAIASLLSMGVYEYEIDCLLSEAEQVSSITPSSAASPAARLHGASPALAAAFWVPLTRALLRVRVSTTPVVPPSISSSSDPSSSPQQSGSRRRKASSNQTSSGNGNDPREVVSFVSSMADAEVLLSLALQACEALPSLLHQFRSLIASLIPAEGIAAADVVVVTGVPKAVQKYASVVLRT